MKPAASGNGSGFCASRSFWNWPDRFLHNLEKHGDEESGFQ